MIGNIAKVTTKEIVYLYVDRIIKNPNQPRKYFSENSINELASSIEEHGVLQPITVRFVNKKYELIAGERRLLASKKANLKYIPCIVVNICEEKSAVLAIIENLQRENLNYFEEAEGYEKLIKNYKYTQEQLAKNIGKTQSTIANKLRLLRLDNKVKEKLLTNSLTERHGRALLKLEDTEIQLEILEKVIKNNLNVADTEKLIEHCLNIQKEVGNTEEKENKRKIRMLIKDIKIFTKTVNHAVEMMQKSGIDANYNMEKTNDGYKMIIDIVTELSCD